MHAAATTDGPPWLVAALAIVIAIGAFGVWMVIYPGDARQFMDHSQRKSAEWFNLREPRATPHSFPRVFGVVVVVFAVVVAALVIASMTGVL